MSVQPMTRRPMKTFVTIAAIVFASSSCGTDLPTSCSGAPRPAVKLLLHPEAGVPGQYIVVFFDSVSDIPGTANALAAKYSGTILFVYEAALRGFALDMDDSKARPLSEEPTVCWVEQSAVGHVD